MKDKLTQYIEHYNSLVLRQRIVFLFLILSLVYVVFYFSYLLPISDEKKELAIENAYLASLYEEAVQLQEGREEKDKALDIVRLNNKLFELKDEVEILNVELKEYFSIASSAEDMMKIVKDLVSLNQGLSLKKMVLLPSEGLSLNLSAQQESNLQVEEADSAPPVEGDDEVSVLKHKVYVEIEGDYQSLAHYLKKIESLTWGVFVETVDYRVETYPVSSAVVILYSLSLGGGEYEL